MAHPQTPQERRAAQTLARRKKLFPLAFKRRVPAGHGVSSGIALNPTGLGLLKGTIKPRDASRANLQAFRTFQARRHRDTSRIDAALTEKFRSETVDASLRQQRLASEQGAKRKFDEGVQAQRPDRFNKIIADTKQREKVRGDILDAGINPATLQRATPILNLEKITTKEGQRKEARRQVGIGVSQLGGIETGRGSTPG